MKTVTTAFCAVIGMMSAGASSQPVSRITAEEAALRECVSLKTTGADRILTVKWLFGVMSKSPHIANLSSVSAAQDEEFDRGFAKLLTRIVTKDCAAEVRPIAARNFENAFEQVGGALGDTAMNELMSAKEIDDAVGAYTRFLSDEEFKPLVDSLPKSPK